MALERPEVVREILGEVLGRFGEGTLRPLPLTVFPITGVTAAFRFMAQERHIGRIVVEVHSHAVEVADPSRDSYALRPDVTYLITGGLGGMGLKTAAWMVEREKTVLDFLARQLGSVLGLDERSIDFDTGLTRMGLDSLMAVELRTKIHLQLRVAVAVIALLQGATLRQLGRLVLDELASSEAPEVTETDLASPAQELLRTLPQMSGAEVEAYWRN